MSCEYSIYPEHSLIIEHFSGHTTREEFENMCHELWQEPEYHNQMNVMMDFRKSEMLYSAEDIKELSMFFKTAPSATKGRGAVLVSSPRETALADLFTLEMASNNLVRTFTTWPAACSFLGVPDLPEATSGSSPGNG